MHRHEDLAFGHRIRYHDFDYDNALGRTNARAISRLQLEFLGVGRVYLDACLFRRELPKDGRFAAAREGVPLSRTPAAGKQDEREVTAIRRRLRVAEDEA